MIHRGNHENLLILGLLGLLSGCVADADDLPEGLTVLESDPARGLAAAYVRDGEAIYVETRRGAPLDEGYQVPGTPVKYLIDTRFLSRDGQPFYIQMAGDDFIDPSWRLPDDEDVDPAAARFDLAIEAADALAALPAIARTQEVQRLRGQARLVRVDGLDQVVPVFTTYTHTVQVHRKNEKWQHSCANVDLFGDGDAQQCAREYGLECCDSPNNPGVGWGSYMCLNSCDCRASCAQYEVMQIHSASAAFTSAHRIERCNHGPCPGDDGMIRQCTEAWGGRSNSLPRSNETCTNDYEKLSSGTNNHNCHDDTTVQVRNVKNNDYGHTAVCGNDSCHLLPPSCDGDYEGSGYGYAIRQR